MNIRRRIVYSLPVALILSACVPLAEHRAHFDNTWNAAEIHRVEVREVSGSITVQAGAGNRVQMSAEVRARGKEAQKGKPNDGYFISEVQGDTLVIETERHERHVFFFNGPGVTVDYKLQVPAGVALELETVNGRIVTRGIAGQTTATTVNGVVDIEATGGSEVAARAINGRIDVHFLNDFHGAQFKTVNGRVNATLPAMASFRGDFTQVNGDFEAGFPLNIHSNPGSRRVSGEVNGGRYPLKITTVNGDIKIDSQTEAAAAR